MKIDIKYVTNNDSCKLQKNFFSRKKIISIARSIFRKQDPQNRRGTIQQFKSWISNRIRIKTELISPL